MFYNFAPHILAIFGALISFLGYYLATICQFRQWIFWTGVCLILSGGGFIVGRLIQKLNTKSHTDFLTKLFNRRYFYQQLNKEAQTKKQGQLCIAMIDIDDFKAINDTYGHAIGDTLLSEFAVILKNNTRSMDTVARWGGDEFAIIFCNTSIETAFEIMDRIRAKIENDFSSRQMTISAGLITLKPDKDLKELLITADRALYKAKEQRNTVIVVNDE